MTCRNQERYTTRVSRNALTAPSIGSIWPRQRKKDITFWQTKSHAVVAHKTVPPACIERVISQEGETTFYQRLSTPRPSPIVILKNAWHQQQQQGDSGSCRKLKRERHEGDDNRVKEVAGTLQREQCCKREGLVSSRSPSWSVTKSHLKDEERMTNKYRH